MKGPVPVRVGLPHAMALMQVRAKETPDERGAGEAERCAEEEQAASGA